MKTNFLNLKTMKTIKFYAMSIITIGMLASCSSDDSTPEEIEDEEAITGLTLTFTNQADSNNSVVLNWNDANEDGVVDAGEQTVVGEFESSAVYNAEIELFNLDENILEEDILADQQSIDAHFFVYGTTLDFDMQRAANDETRSDMNKLGVNTVWTAGAAGTGNISIELYHLSPNVSDSNGFGTAEGDDTDIDITFSAVIN